MTYCRGPWTRRPISRSQRSNLTAKPVAWFCSFLPSPNIHRQRSFSRRFHLNAVASTVTPSAYSVFWTARTNIHFAEHAFLTQKRLEKPRSSPSRNESGKLSARENWDTDVSFFPPGGGRHFSRLRPRNVENRHSRTSRPFHTTEMISTASSRYFRPTDIRIDERERDHGQCRDWRLKKRPTLCFMFRTAKIAILNVSGILTTVIVSPPRPYIYYASHYTSPIHLLYINTDTR